MMKKSTSLLYQLSDMQEFQIDIPALKRPTLEELRVQDNSIQSIERDTSLESPITLRLVTFFDIAYPHIGKIDGLEYDQRLVPYRDALLGYQHLDWLIKRQTEYRAFTAMLKKVIRIDFSGIVVRTTGNVPQSPCCAGEFVHVKQAPRRWECQWRFLYSGFSSADRMALPSEAFILSMSNGKLKR
jgi:hypothetical protein